MIDDIKLRISIPRIHLTRKLLTCLIVASFLTAPILSSIQNGEAFLVKGQFKEAIEVLSPMADQNNPRALYILGCIYLNQGSGYLNYQKGISLLEKAVTLNYGPALNELAGLYLSGEGVPQNEAKALHYYVQGSYVGYGPSQFNCGIMYKEGQGCEKNPVKAYLFLSLASLNRNDLDDLTIDAAKYRDELVVLLTPEQRREVLSQVNQLTLPSER